MRALIFSDIHTRHEIVQGVLDKEKFDKVYFLGDYFDDFWETVSTNVQTAKWLKELLYDSRFHFLFGNHDTHYAYPSHRTMCSGYSETKCIAINTVLKERDWSKFEFYFWLDDWLLTHAGFSFDLFKTFKIEVGELNKFLKFSNEKAKKALKKEEHHWMFQAGKSRSGLFNCGGLTWCDYHKDFKTIEGVKQVFGHTILPKPLITENTINIDTNSSHYLVYENGRMDLKET